ncbi:MAG: vitamin K epoxide reductase family protein [Acidobacteriaceae bacterium]
MKFFKYLIALLALAGIVVSSMALHVHLMDPNAAPPCAVSEHWDCGAVGHSRYSWLPPKTMDEIVGDAPPSKLHIPVAALGIAAYAVIAILALMGQVLLVFEIAQVGFFFAAFLSYIEAYILEKWCIYCVWSQGIIVVLFLLSSLALLLEWQQRRTAATVAQPANQ